MFWYHWSNVNTSWYKIASIWKWKCIHFIQFGVPNLSLFDMGSKRLLLKVSVKNVVIWLIKPLILMLRTWFCLILDQVDCRLPVKSRIKLQAFHPIHQLWKCQKFFSSKQKINFRKLENTFSCHHELGYIVTKDLQCSSNFAKN